jgi:GH24 family phage-related lysozyme (muramidase)
MKKSLTEELNRMHSMMYGKQMNESDFVDNFLKNIGFSKEDDPIKADFVEDDLESFYDTLESAAEKGGLTQQPTGGIDYQKEVESMQIGLILLGYDLPRFGVDGLFGPETASAVNKFTSDKVSGEIKEDFVRLGDTNYSHVKFDTDGTQNDQINQALLDDLQVAGSRADVVITITTAKSGHSKLTINGRPSRHATNTAVDIALLDGIGAGGATNETNGNSRFRELGNRVKNELLNMGYSLNAEGGNKRAVLWQTNTGGNHYNHLHVSNIEGVLGSAPSSPSSPSETMVKATPEMLKKLIELLKEKGVSSEDLKKLTDPLVGNVEISLSGNWLEMTKQLIRKFETFTDKASGDEGTYRGGYGTSKKLVDGELVDVTAETTWTKDEAEETLDYQLKNTFGPIVASQLGSYNWEKLNDFQKASLLSFAYNAGPYVFTAREYGKNIKNAIEDGDMEAAAAYISQGPTTGAKSGKYYPGLSKRREFEAKLFLN